MPLPETIPVRFSEEEAEYVSLRPIRRQQFSTAELLEMILSVTGRDAQRIRQILHAGTIVYHRYRYWWPRIDAGDAEIAQLLAQFPADDAALEFRASECSAVLLQSDEKSRPIELRRDALSQKRFLRRTSVWDLLMKKAGESSLIYSGYSYEWRGDLFARDISESLAKELAADAERIVPRNLRQEVKPLANARRLLFVCPRTR